MNILGINAYHGDASAALVQDGRLIVAVEEERFNRIKHTAGFPGAAIRYCLEHAGIDAHELDHIALSRDPSVHLQQKVLFALSKRPSFGLVKEHVAKIGKVRDLRETLAEAIGTEVATIRAIPHRVEHHRAHMASAFLVSPFDEAACLSIDGFGDFVSAMWGMGRGTTIDVLDFVAFPHSAGLFYTAVTQYLGFTQYGDEYKVMGLSPYGEPEYLDDFRTVLRTHRRGYRLDLDYFVHHTDGVPMVWDAGQPTIGRIYSDAFVRRFGPARDPGEPLDQRHRNLAASVQALIEEIYFHLLTQLHERTGARTLCLAGGVAYNSVANGKIRRLTPFDDVFIQPAAGDAGTAIGAAFTAWHEVSGAPRLFEMRHAAWGSESSDAEIAAALDAQNGEVAASGARVRRADSDDHVCELAADAIVDGSVLGWFQGRMEWGARALGQRSILADPRRASMKDVINARIKRRESFRPFCPSILRDRVADYFEGAAPDPFMLSVFPVKADKRGVIPAVTHVDGTGRLQAVDDETPMYARLLRAFERRTGVPVLLNTSFNENEPIVRTPREALACFLRTEMDVLVMGRYLIERVRRPVPAHDVERTQTVEAV